MTVTATAKRRRRQARQEKRAKRFAERMPVNERKGDKKKRRG
jgi:hypothetical protein